MDILFRYEQYVLIAKRKYIPLSIPALTRSSTFYSEALSQNPSIKGFTPPEHLPEKSFDDYAPSLIVSFVCLFVCCCCCFWSSFTFRTFFLPKAYDPTVDMKAEDTNRV